MDIFKWFKKPKSRDSSSFQLSQQQFFSLLDSSPELWNLLSGTHGTNIGAKTVLGLPALYRAIELQADVIASVPCEVLKRIGDNKDADTDHPAWNLLRWQPSPEYDSTTWIKAMVLHRKTQGNGYTYIVRDPATAEPNELLLLDPLATYPIRENGRLWYVTTTATGQTLKLDPADVIHLKGLSYDGLRGVSVVDELRVSLNLSANLQNFAAKFFENSAQPGVVISVPGDLSEEKGKQLREDWATIHQGMNNQHRIGILQRGMTLQPSLMFNNEQSQFLQSREFSDKQLANIAGIPCEFLGLQGGYAYNALEESNLNLLYYSLDPIMTALERELRRKVLTESEKRNDSHTIEFNRQVLMRVDPSKAIALKIQQCGKPYRTRNEMRALDNLPPVKEWDEQDIDGPPVPKPLLVAGENIPQPTQPTAEPPTKKVKLTQQQEALLRHELDRNALRLCRYVEKAANDPPSFYNELVLMPTKNEVVRQNIGVVCGSMALDGNKLTADLFRQVATEANEASGEYTASDLKKGITKRLNTTEIVQQVMRHNGL